MRPFAVPVVVVSRCLCGEACRYDGKVLPAGFAERLLPHVRAVPVCPEVGIGLGVPREPIQIERTGKGRATRLVQPSTGLDLTRRMKEFRAHFLGGLGAVDGFLLKAGSPSCAVSDAKVVPAGGGDVPPARGPGMFAEAVLTRLPHVAVADEIRLARVRFREHFLTRIFATAAFREEVGKRPSKARLSDYHSRNELLLAAVNRKAMRALSAIVADPGRRPVGEMAADYGTRLLAALERTPPASSHVNILLDVVDRLRASPGAREKARFLDTLAGYRARRLPLSAPVAVARALVEEHAAEGLAAQTYFRPFPPELADAGTRRAD